MTMKEMSDKTIKCVYDRMLVLYEKTAHVQDGQIDAVLAEEIGAMLENENGADAVQRLRAGVEQYRLQMKHCSLPYAERVIEQERALGCSEEEIRARNNQRIAQMLLELDALTGHYDLSEEERQQREEIEKWHDADLSGGELDFQEQTEKMNALNEQIVAMRGLRAAQALDYYERRELLLNPYESESRASRAAMCYAAARYVEDREARQEPEALGFLSAAERDAVTTYQRSLDEAYDREKMQERLGIIAGVMIGALTTWKTIKGVFAAAELADVWALLTGGISLGANLNLLFPVGCILLMGVLLGAVVGYFTYLSVDESVTVRGMVDRHVKEKEKEFIDEKIERAGSVLRAEKKSFFQRVIAPCKRAVTRICDGFAGRARTAESRMQEERAKEEAQDKGD